MSRLISRVVLEKPLRGAAHAFLVQLVTFQAPIAGILSAPADRTWTTSLERGLAAGETGAFAVPAFPRTAKLGTSPLFKTYAKKLETVSRVSQLRRQVLIQRTTA
jgi:hypothetical protein